MKPQQLKVAVACICRWPFTSSSFDRECYLIPWLAWFQYVKLYTLFSFFRGNLFFEGEKQGKNEKKKLSHFPERVIRHNRLDEWRVYIKILCNAWNMKLIWIAKHKNEMWDSCFLHGHVLYLPVLWWRRFLLVLWVLVSEEWWLFPLDSESFVEDLDLELRLFLILEGCWTTTRGGRFE